MAGFRTLRRSAKLARRNLSGTAAAAYNSKDNLSAMNAQYSCLVVEDPHFETVKLICDLVNKAADRAAIVGLDAFAERARTRGKT